MTSEPTGTERRSIRHQILEAAEELMRDLGVGAVTTRAIAERAGCAEGSIYRHFPHKQALMVEIIRSRFPAFLQLVASLPDQAGQGSVRTNLEAVVAQALAFHRGVMPLIVGPMGDQELLLEQRRHFHDTGTGPMPVFRDVTAYLRAEQDRGRISRRVSPEHVTRLLLGTCFAQAFLEGLVGDEAGLGSDEQFVKHTVGSLMAGLEPRPVPRRGVSQATHSYPE